MKAERVPLRPAYPCETNISLSVLGAMESFSAPIPTVISLCRRPETDYAFSRFSPFIDDSQGGYRHAQRCERQHPAALELPPDSDLT